jgi:hypothetical protein
MINAINMGWYQLSQYYEKTDECPAYATALLLHPSRRAKYINTNWEPQWRPAAMSAARSLWADYKDRPIFSRPVQPEGGITKPLSKFQSLQLTLNVLEDHEDEDELEKFINGIPTHIAGTALDWWAREEQRLEYPRLYQMALDILSIPPLSDKLEGVFSGVRRSIPWERGSVHMRTVEIQESICNWNLNGLLYEEDHVNKLLIEATSVVEAAQEDRAMEMSDDEIN